MGGYALSHYALSGTVRRRLNRCAGCGLTLFALTMATAVWATTYRWVDEQGKVHYGDSIPPQYAGQGHTELNAQGRVIRRIERAPSSAEARARRAQDAERKAAETLANRERQRRDNALLATYSNTGEIEQAKRRAIEQEQALLDSLLIMRKHSESEAENDYIAGMVRQRQQNLEAIRSKYDADKARYIELTGRR